MIIYMWDRKETVIPEKQTARKPEKNLGFTSKFASRFKISANYTNNFTEYHPSVQEKKPLIQLGLPSTVLRPRPRKKILFLRAG